MFDETVSGFGTVSHLAGFTSLTGDWSSFFGDSDISGGVMSIDTVFGDVDSADFAIPVTVQNGGTVTGTGTVAGNLIFNTGSTYQVDIATTDFLDVGDRLTIESGARVALIANGLLALPLGESTTILAASTSGSFDTLAEDFLFLDASLDQSEDGVDLTVDRNDLSFAAIAETGNQAAVGDALDGLNEEDELFQHLVVLSNTDEARDAFGQLSGEVHASTQGALFQVSGAIRDAVNARIRSTFDRPSIQSSGQGAVASVNFLTGTINEIRPAYSLWGQAYGTFGNFRSDGNASETKRAAGGLLSGVDTMVSGDWRVGAFLGYGHTTIDVDDLNSSADADSFTAGAYAGRFVAPVRLQFGSSVTVHDVAARRDVNINGFTDRPEAQYLATTLQAFGQAGYAFDVRRGMSLEPFAGASLIYQQTEGFTETGGAAALSARTETFAPVLTALGLNGQYDLGRLKNGMRVTLDASLAWQHMFGDAAPVSTLQFASGGTPFTVAGSSFDRDAVLVGADLKFNFRNGMDLALGYSGVLAERQQDQTFSANLKLKF